MSKKSRQIMLSLKDGGGPMIAAKQILRKYLDSNRNCQCETSAATMQILARFGMAIDLITHDGGNSERTATANKLYEKLFNALETARVESQNDLDALLLASFWLLQSQFCHDATCTKRHVPEFLESE